MIHARAYLRENQPLRSRPLSPAPQLPAVIRSRPAVSARAVAAEIVLWTTRDGREIPLEEMSDEHVRNAVAALSRWRARIRRQDGQQAMKRQLDDAIQRFRRILRGRVKAAGKPKPAKHSMQRRIARMSRREP